jgi:Tfp pilus assembly protein PilN
MIEINLTPGVKKAKRSGGPAPSFKVAPMFSGLSPSLKDPFLFIAIAGIAIGLAGTGYLYTTLAARESDLTERETVAVRDSATYAAILAERRTAEAKRDTVQRQLAIIQLIDGERFVWPHLLDEISEALPAYTWVRSIAQTSPVPTIAERDAFLRGPVMPDSTAADTAGAPPRAPIVPPPPPPLAIRLVGRTVDIQALTQFMRTLEASPFIENVVLVRSDLVRDEERDVTEFGLDMRYQKPDSSAIRTVPLVVGGR